MAAAGVESGPSAVAIGDTAATVTAAATPDRHHRARPAVVVDRDSDPPTTFPLVTIDG